MSERYEWTERSALPNTFAIVREGEWQGINEPPAKQNEGDGWLEVVDACDQWLSIGVVDYAIVNEVFHLADEADRYRKASAEAYENWMTAASECNEKDAEIARLRERCERLRELCGTAHALLDQLVYDGPLLEGSEEDKALGIIMRDLDNAHMAALSTEARDGGEEE